MNANLKVKRFSEHMIDLIWDIGALSSDLERELVLPLLSNLFTKLNLTVRSDTKQQYASSILSAQRWVR